jgi:thiosulfate/3-mercaptopyruvate sulfurtransferase
VPAPINTAVQARIHRAVAEGTPARSLDEADLAAIAGAGTADRRQAVLVTAGELFRRLAEPEPPVLLDVRWALGDPDGAGHYRAGHVPGAVYVDLDTELAGPHEPGAGRHPLPAIADLQANARRWGVTRRRGVVVYDNTGGLAAARAWWLLRWAGVPDVRILDGGLAAWSAAGHRQATGAGNPRPASDIVLSAGHLPTLTADEAATLAGAGVLLDARAAERYRGEVEPVDPRAGHIPGARSAPTTENLQSGVPYFRSTAELRERFRDVGAEPGVYCGSGVTAAHEVAALAIAGIDAALYPGSWSAWSSDPARPVETSAPVASGE